jgi:hypothetical protein
LSLVSPVTSHDENRQECAERQTEEQDDDVSGGVVSSRHRPKPYAVAVTDSVNRIDAKRFHRANWLNFIFAVPEMTAGVKNTACPCQ